MLIQSLPQISKTSIFLKFDWQNNLQNPKMNKVSFDCEEFSTYAQITIQYRLKLKASKTVNPEGIRVRILRHFRNKKQVIRYNISMNEAAKTCALSHNTFRKLLKDHRQCVKSFQEQWAEQDFLYCYNICFKGSIKTSRNHLLL